jgi:hypothetical protein
MTAFMWRHFWGKATEMVWAKREFSYADYTPYMDHLEKLLLSNPSLYREFIMISTDTPNARDSDYYVGVPNISFLAPFDGFEMVEEKDLPKQINTVHIADQTTDEFKSRFRFRSRR